MRAVSDWPPRPLTLARGSVGRVLLWLALLVPMGLASIGTAALGTPASGVHLAAASPFVTSSGGQLYLNGRPWQFTGYDAYQLPSVKVGAQYNCGGSYSTSWLNQNLDEMKSGSGAAVVRTWFFQSYSADNYAQFDTVLAAAAARNIKIIPVLVNQWGDCEPGWGSQGQRPYRSLAWYQGGYRQTGDGYPLSFRDYAINIAAHYANNPTIAFWQLVNEAEAMGSASGPCDNTAAGNALRGFADDMVTAMKSVDRNHLVSLGTMGGGQCGTQGSEYQYVHAGAADICEYHDYGAPSAPLPGGQWNGVSADIQECAALHKPIFAGESGIDASIQPDGSTPGAVTAASLQLRATYFAQKLQAQFARHIAGFLIWSKSLSPSTSFDVGPGDPTEAVMASTAAHLNAGAASPPRPSRAPAPKRPAPRTGAPATATPAASRAASEALQEARQASSPDSTASAAPRHGLTAVSAPVGTTALARVAPAIVLLIGLMALAVWCRVHAKRPRTAVLSG